MKAICYRPTIIEYIILTIYAVLPFLDSLNGYLVRHGRYSIGSLYHMVFCIVIFLLYLHSVNLKVNMRGTYFFLCIFITLIVLSYLLNSIGNSHYSMEFNRVFKLLCTFIEIVSLEGLLEHKKIRQNTLDKILGYSSILIPTVILLPYLLGIGNATYISSQSGHIGFYTSSNELNAILLILLLYNLNIIYRWYRYKGILKYNRITLVLLITICRLLIESKTSIILTFIVLLIYALAIMFRTKRYVKKSVCYIFIILALDIPILIKVLHSIYLSFITRQNAIRTIYSATNSSFYNFILYFSSGRIGRIKSYILEPITELFHDNHSWYGITRIVWGNGFNNIGEKIFEMELFDFFVWLGIAGVIFFIAFSVSVLKQCYKVHKEYFPTLNILIIITYGCLVGHTFVGGVAGIYVALFLANYLVYKENIF